MAENQKTPESIQTERDLQDADLYQADEQAARERQAAEDEADRIRRGQ